MIVTSLVRFRPTSFTHNVTIFIWDMNPRATSILARERSSSVSIASLEVDISAIAEIVSVCHHRQRCGHMGVRQRGAKDDVREMHTDPGFCGQSAKHELPWAGLGTLRRTLKYII